MIDAETKERLDEIEDRIRAGPYCTVGDVVGIVLCLAILFCAVGTIVVVLTWDRICEQIAVNILEQAAGQLAPSKDYVGGPLSREGRPGDREVRGPNTLEQYQADLDRMWSKWQAEAREIIDANR